MERSDKPLYSKNIRNNLVDAEFERDDARKIARTLYRIIKEESTILIDHIGLPDWLTK